MAHHNGLFIATPSGTPGEEADNPRLGVRVRVGIRACNLAMSQVRVRIRIWV